VKTGVRHDAVGNSKKTKAITVIDFALAAALYALCTSAYAQQPTKIPWIGYLAGAGSGPAPSFIEGLRDLGYVEAKNIGIVFRTSESRPERYTDLIAEVIRLKVDVIVADGSSLALAVKKATSTIPIVVSTSTDPVGIGLIKSMARPGGNVTGLTTLTEELGGKQLELLKEIVAGINRVAILRPRGPANDIFVKETEPTAQRLGVKLIPLVFRSPEDFEELVRSAIKERANGLIERLGPGTSLADRKRVVDLTLKNHLPTVSSVPGWADDGGLLTYGADRNALYRRTATYVEKILKGAKPADLPMEQPTKFQFIVNLKAAKEIGLIIPPNVLARADRVIRWVITMRQQATVKKPEAKILSFGLAGLIFALSSGVEAQQAGKVYRIGVLSVGVPASSLDIEAFRQGLRDLGYVEGKNLEYRYFEGRVERMPQLADEFVRLKVDIRGAKPGDLPVEQPTKFEFVINLITAKQIGLTIPPNVLARADRVIK
jgi:putative ABC transport system substrate-binding protein